MAVGHPPHSLPAYGVGRAGSAGSAATLLELYGALPLLAALAAPFLLKGRGSGYWARRARRSPVGCPVGDLLCVEAGLLRAQFRARACSVGAGGSARARRRSCARSWLRAAVGVVLVALPMAYWSIQIASATRWPEEAGAEFEAGARARPGAAHLLRGDPRQANCRQRCERVAVHELQRSVVTRPISTELAQRRVHADRALSQPVSVRSSPARCTPISTGTCATSAARDAP